MQQLDRHGFELAREQFARPVISCNLRQLIIVFEEESKVLERHIHVGVATLLAVLLNRRLSAREGVLVDLVFDLLGRVGHKDTRRIDRGRHLALSAEQRRDELGVNQSWLFVLESRRHFPRQTEIGILINGTRNQARNIRFGAKDLRERIGEGRCGLDRYERPFPDVVFELEAESLLRLSSCDQARNLHHVAVEGTTVNAECDQLLRRGE